MLTLSTVQKALVNSRVKVEVLSNVNFFTSSTERKSHNDASHMKTPSSDKAPEDIPYKNPGPANYGYFSKIWDGGVKPSLPEGEFPKPNKKDHWEKKKALFGYNDYIDILGDESIVTTFMPGPPWVVGYRGNEYGRLSRRMKFEGDRLKKEEPVKYHNIMKRMFYLHKKYNQKRVSRWK